MTDRLKQIWRGFEGVTTRHLTGRGIDHIVAPQPVNFKAKDADFLPTEFSAPSQAAFDALRTRLAVQEDRVSRGQGKKSRKRLKDSASYSGREVQIDGVPRGAEELVKGLASTENRILRPTRSYVAQMSSDAGRELDSLKKRKKIFGIF